eukprot:CAMPEP_0204891544 /NCGR_PEP_ID=MMETSP1349-20130617/27485_1 /ASSEMBLY_ACC=CAM_ASM_000710 /TAXON_ID=215587 /ORGANISM="Aplanochytrium stocchinoi, Strain GSBS06" /LENGTH=94 /DNA_ID=CAMNT_0052056975 /DNA_START=318 /DNA_END=602 /DNA_ORIENTATION=+
MRPFDDLPLELLFIAARRVAISSFEDLLRGGVSGGCGACVETRFGDLDLGFLFTIVSLEGGVSGGCGPRLFPALFALVCLGDLFFLFGKSGTDA